MTTSVLFVDWGDPHETFGCQDKSDISQKMTATDASNLTCGDAYKQNNPNNPDWSVDWTWFACHQTQKCIHIDSRCDLHPNIECVYVRNGVLVAEDEEECFDEYKRKGLISNSANFICQSPLHNTKTPTVLSNMAWWVLNLVDSVWYIRYAHNVSIIPEGTKVEIKATRCNGVSECWNNEDEEGCGLRQFETILTGNCISKKRIIF